MHPAGSIQISVVIPTCNRRERLLSLLGDLNQSSYPLAEVIVVDAGEDRLSPEDYAIFERLAIRYVPAQKSVCIQRNTGIRMAISSWIFLCDDDMEVPTGYLQMLVNHAGSYPGAGAVSGQWLEKKNGKWEAAYPVHSARELYWKYIFQLGIWGGISCNSNNRLLRRIKNYYTKKGNHISKAGWPVNTDFNGEYSVCPVYSLGAALIKKEWLIASPYDEVLDAHGIGDNYGVAVGFPEAIHIVNHAQVYHHHEQANRLVKPLQYYRRILALDYFMRVKPVLKHQNKYRLLWSLTGNLLLFLYSREWNMCRANFKAMRKILFNQNPYLKGRRLGILVVEPGL